MMDMQAALSDVLAGKNLNQAAMSEVMHLIMSGQATDAQIGGFLIALRLKGETVEEITAAAQVMRELATTVSVKGDHLVDTCGTGGDGARTFNISTTCAFVVAAAGGRVAKHGNRSVSSASGSADVLEAAGVRLDLTPVQVAQCIDEVGIGFMFAPRHHSAMKYAIGPRREMGVRTLFNVLGPLTNPAAAPSQLIGVFADHWRRPLAAVLHALGSQHAMVVHAHDGMDELSIAAPTEVSELHQGHIKDYTICPGDVGLTIHTDTTELIAHGVEDSLSCMLGVLDGSKTGAARDIVLFNAGAAIYVAGKAQTLAAGVNKATAAIDSGDARHRLSRLVDLSHQLLTHAGESL